MADKIRIGVLGASGYTGADIVRMAQDHPAMEIVTLTGATQAGQPMADVFGHLAFAELPDLITVDAADWSKVDAVFCGLPHGTTQDLIKAILAKHPHVKVIDMSADFRLRDAD